MGSGGSVEVFVRAGGRYYAVRRVFNPLVTGSSPNITVQFCPDKPLVYRLDSQTDSLEPVQSFKFMIEVYEQGRISRLRADVGRQLEMLDEFAGVGEQKKRRGELVSELILSAEALAPLYEEREQLKGAVAGLSQLQEDLGAKEGEQSAAILTLALHTRSMPLVIDQPEDELGYSYVVHLIVPKILKAKFSRQILTITHNANIPVLGDADYVIKMENRPRTDSGRTCVVANAGSFESVAVTRALIELEGGQRAFNFRRFRYAIPSNSV